MMTVGDAVRAARARLIIAGISEREATLDAARLAMLALDWDRATLLTRDLDPAPLPLADRLDALLQRRETREPMAYIRGTQEFWGRDFFVSPAVLIPRPETELLIETALAWRASRPALDAPAIIDVGTGSGCIAVTLACEWPDARIIATDISDTALAVARDNARQHDVHTRITFVHGPYLANTAAPIDLIVANPPYVSERSRPAMQPEVRDHEPHTALFGGIDGLRDVRAICAEAGEVLADDGVLLMEIGDGQEDGVREAVLGTPRLSLIEIRDDLQGIPRAAILRRATA